MAHLTYLTSNVITVRLTADASLELLRSQSSTANTSHENRFALQLHTYLLPHLQLELLQNLTPHGGVKPPSILEVFVEPTLRSD